jgi:hypothetical protein
MPRKIALFFAGSSLFLFLAAGCGADCKTACSKIYDECKMSFTGTSKDQCVETCQALTGSCTYKEKTMSCKDAGIQCTMDTACANLQICF